jgi:hypothetical protein
MMNVIYHVKWMSPHEEKTWIVAQDTVKTIELPLIIKNLIDTGAVIVSVQPVVP